MKKLTLSLVLASILAIGFTGCGDSSSAEDAVDDVLSNSDIGLVIPSSGSYTCDNTQEFNGKTYTMKIGTTNQFSANCDYGELTFTNETNEFSISQLTKKTTVTTAYDDGSTIYAVIDEDLEQKTQHIAGDSSEHGAFDCTNSYDIELPITIYSADEVDLSIEDYQITNSNCPDWMDDEDLEDEEPKTMTMVTNITVTEEGSNETSIISQYMSIK